MAKKIKIAALTMVCNEELLLPYFLRHYRDLDEIHVLYETDSNDNTLEILKAAPNIIVKKCHIGGGFDEINKVNLINKALNTITADWVYVVDCDEFIFSLQEPPNDFLSRQDRNNYNVVRAAMFQVYRHRTDKNLNPFLPPIPQRVYGDPDLFSIIKSPNRDYNAHYIKPIIVKPSSKIWFQPGNHAIEGKTKVSPELYIGAHWQMADPSIAINRRIKNRIRMSKRNKKLGLTWQHFNVTEKWIKAECNRHLDDPLIEELYFFSNKDFFNNIVDKIGSREFSKLFRLPKEENARIRDFFSQLIHYITTRIQKKTILISELENQKKHLQKSSITIGSKNNFSIARVENDPQEKEFQIQQIQRSILMRLAKRYDKVMEKILPTGTRRRYYYELFLNGIRIILNEGCHSFCKKAYYCFIHRPAELKQVHDPAELNITASEPKISPKSINGIPSPDKIASLNEIKDLVFKPVASPLVSIVMLAHNQWQYTYVCLKSILKNTTGFNYEVILVDNYSTDLTSTMLKKVRGVKLIKNKENLGFVKGCNGASAFAKGKYILFLNNDTYVIKGWLKTILGIVEKDDKVGIVGPNLISPDGKLQENGWIIGIGADKWVQPIGKGRDPKNYEYNYLKEVDCVTGACMLVRKDVFLKVGLFNEIYAPGYCEETDLAFTIRKKGYKVMVQPKAKVVHFGNITYGLNESRWRFSRNYSIFLKRWGPILDNRPKCFNNYFWLRDRSQGKKVILIISERVFGYDKNIDSFRAYQYAKLLQKMDFKVIFLPDNLKKIDPYVAKMQQLGIEVIYGKFNFNSWLKDNGKYIDLVWLSGPDISIKYFKKLRNQTNAKILINDKSEDLVKKVVEFYTNKDPLKN